MIRNWTAIGVLFFLALLPLMGEAQRPKSLASGAVRKPITLRIQPPFPCGTPLHINCGYGPGCSPAHKRTNNDSGPNDYYAIDFTRIAPRNGFNKPVVAVAPGVIRYAGWTKRGWAPYGKIVYIEHTFHDPEGHRYQTLYAHLNQVSVQPGQRVEPGTVIGMLGGSSKGRLGKFGPHLHFAMYQDAKSTLGGGRAVIPEPLGDYTDLRTSMDLIACERLDSDRVATVFPLFPRSIAFGGLLEFREP